MPKKGRGSNIWISEMYDRANKMGITRYVPIKNDVLVAVCFVVEIMSLKIVTNDKNAILCHKVIT